MCFLKASLILAFVHLPAIILDALQHCKVLHCETAGFLVPFTFKRGITWSLINMLHERLPMTNFNSILAA